MTLKELQNALATLPDEYADKEVLFDLEAVGHRGLYAGVDNVSTVRPRQDGEFVVILEEGDGE